MHFTMKKTYIAPQTNAIALNIDSNILNASPGMMNVSDSETMTSDEFLSNKKENPVWGGQSKGPWGK